MKTVWLRIRWLLRRPRLHVFHNDYEWHVAENVEQCRAWERELIGREADEVEWWQEPDHLMKRIQDTEQEGRDEGPHPNWMWCVLEGHGLLCSTEY